jgi:hypothetical protein
MYPRKNVGRYSSWNYAVPPMVLMNSFPLEPASVNQDELSRAEWFGHRRPKLLCQTLACVFCYLIVFLCLLCLLCRDPERGSLLLLWMVAGVSCAIVDGVRFDQWTNEYKSSIKRAIVHLLER